MIDENPSVAKSIVMLAKIANSAHQAKEKLKKIGRKSKYYYQTGLKKSGSYYLVIRFTKKPRVKIPDYIDGFLIKVEIVKAHPIRALRIKPEQRELCISGVRHK